MKRKFKVGDRVIVTNLANDDVNTVYGIILHKVLTIKEIPSRHVSEWDYFVDVSHLIRKGSGKCGVDESEIELAPSEKLAREGYDES